MNRILVLNPGSTSFKFKLFLFDGTDNEQVLAEGTFERIGQTGGGDWFAAFGGIRLDGRHQCADCLEAFDKCVEIMWKHHILQSLDDLDAACFKAVHGGSVTGTNLVDSSLLYAMEEFSDLAPAHNPPYIRLMRALKERYPALKLAVRFETAFHQTIPLYRRLYGIPFEWAEHYGILRYGFHGSSHEYIAWRMSTLMPHAKKILSMHLGGSSSICAITDGLSTACSMGGTPQSGLFQNNRAGDFDVYCLPLLERKGYDTSEVLRILATESGLKGLSGISGDMRDVEAAYERGDERAEIAVRAFVDNIVGYAGMFAAFMGGLDAIVFTGGIGQNSLLIRSLVCEKLRHMGVVLGLQTEQGKSVISSDESEVSVLTLPTNEELIVARHVNAFLADTIGTAMRP